MAQMAEIGINLRDPGQLVGTLSGGERQTLAIARAEYFGARVLILDEPTSALGVKEAAIVLRHVIRARSRGLAVIFITHNVQHALPVGDRFTILSHGRLAGEFRRGEVGQDELLRLMGGGDELQELARELDELMAASDGQGCRRPASGMNEPPPTAWRAGAGAPRPSLTWRELAGVSTATVSRVLSGRSRGRGDSRERVLAAARTLDYRPSGVARSLKLRTTHTLGLLITDIQNPFFPELVRAIEDRARDRGYVVLLGNGANDPEREGAFLELLAARRVDGVVVASRAASPSAMPGGWGAPGCRRCWSTARAHDGSHAGRDERQPGRRPAGGGAPAGAGPHAAGHGHRVPRTTRPRWSGWRAPGQRVRGAPGGSVTLVIEHCERNVASGAAAATTACSWRIRM